MQADLARAVHGFLQQTLVLHAQWSEGAGPQFDVGRTQLKQLYDQMLHQFPPRPLSRDPQKAHYYGFHYPLACWVDELFTLNSPISSEWNERKLEAEYFGSNDRAWRFWEQAKLSLDLPTTDELEIFFLCVTLGFRGEWAENEDILQTWLTATWDRLQQQLAKKFTGPSTLSQLGPAPPRYAAASLRRMAKVGAIFTLIAIPVVSLLISRHMSGG